MTTGRFDYALSVGAAPEVALALLSDFSRHVELHPLIVKVEEKPAPAGALRRFAISDRLPLGPVTLPIRYAADVLELTTTGVTTLARQWPATTVRNTTRVTPEAGGAHIAVSIEFSAPRMLYPYAFAQARAAHAELATRIAAALA